MKLFQAFHELPNDTFCVCQSPAFADWRVWITRLDGGCDCDFFQSTPEGDWLFVNNADIPEGLYRSMIASDSWWAGKVHSIGE